ISNYVTPEDFFAMIKLPAFPAPGSVMAIPTVQMIQMNQMTTVLRKQNSSAQRIIWRASVQKHVFMFPVYAMVSMIVLMDTTKEFIAV
ncbi:hypothetical protein NDU88_005732, partial [Pleurodeles waltl]